MTLSHARDPFAGINHWKRKHIPAATQICQHPTAARARAREREREARGCESARGTFTRGARMTEMIPAERERTRVNKREIMTRPRPTFRTHTRTCTFTCSRAYGRQRPAVRHAGFSGGATESEGATRDARRISEEARETRARDRESVSVDQRRGVLAWMTRHCRGARVPRNHTACTRVYTRTHAYAARAGTSEALSARYARVHWVTWKCVS